MKQQINNNILNDEIYSKIQLQRTKIDDEYEILVQNKTVEKLQEYQALIKDYIAFIVKQKCVQALKSKWQIKPQQNIYDYANQIDEVLVSMNQSIEQQNDEDWAKYKGILNKLLDKFSYDL